MEEREVAVGEQLSHAEQAEKGVTLQLPKETLDYFRGDEIRARVFFEKYALKDDKGNIIEKIPPELWHRIARELASVEKTKEKRTEWEEKFNWLLEDFRFLPGGRIMFGAGQKRKNTLLNCYVIPMKEDSIEAIFEWCKEAARTYSYGGGVGGDISTLRPRGAPVNNSAVVSTGAVSFMNIMSETTHVIGQSGRRGALMITLDVGHPDIFDFISVKRNLKQVRYANISVKVTDEFMQAVEENKDFTLKFENPKVKVERKVKARDVWDELIKSARDWAEPGIMFWDSIKKYSPSEYNGMEVISTNPCVTGDTPVLTPDGWKRVDTLNVGDDITTAYGTTKKITEVYVHEDQDIYKVKFSDGGEITATKGHIFHTRKGRVKDKFWDKFWDKETRLSDLKPGDMVRVPKITAVPKNAVDTHGINDRDYGFMLGVLLGDGCYTPKVIDRGHAKIASDYREKDWNENVVRAFSKVSSNIVVASSGKDNGCYIMLQKQGAEFILNKTLLNPAKSFEKEIPLEYINSNRELHHGMIDGLFSTDGNVNLNKSNPTLRLSSSSPKLLEAVRSILLFYGIHSKVYAVNIKEHKFADRFIVPRHTAYSLNIYGYELMKFAAIFSLTHPDKQKKLEKLRDMSCGASSDFSTIKSIDYVGKAKVYDLFEKETDTWITNGYTSRGCSEQPLQGYGACDLGSVNLSAFVIYPFTEKSAIDWQGLEMAVRYGVRFLDNVLDYNNTKHPLEAQDKAVLNSRRIGLGITGLADMFVKMRIKYDSDEALSFADNLFDAIKRISYDESTKIAKEKGSFALFDKKKHLSMPFIKQLDEGIRKSIEENGLRHVAILTVPPTGSISVLAGTSSGIEPIFALSYTRRSESLSKGSFKVYHPLVDEFKQLTGVDDDKVPDYFVVAHKIKPEFRVKMQGTIQKHIDSAISSTVNLAEDSTVEKVSDIYFQAWKAGCKSITVYREGSREGILITDEQDKKDKKKAGLIEPEMQPIKQTRWERPQAMIGKTINMRAYQGSLYVTANFDGELIKEVFVDLGKGGTEEKSYCEALGRLISKYLQAGGDAREVINSLKGIRSNNVIWANGLKLYSVPDSIAKALEIALGITGTQTGIKEFRPDGTVETLDGTPVENIPGHKASKCPTCSEISLVNEGGCMICKSCGYTKCE